MAVPVGIPTALRSFTAGRAQVEVEGSNVGEVIENLLRTYDGLARQIRDDKGQLRSFVNVFLNDEDVRHLEGRYSTAVKPAARAAAQRARNGRSVNMVLMLAANRGMASLPRPGLLFYMS